MLALCVDDERLGMEALKQAVSSAPQVTDTAAFDNESEALLWAKKHRPDVAFLDIRMHEMDGLVLAQNLRALHPSLHIVFCTGYENYAIRAMNLHIDASYLMKPVQPEEVVRELDRILAKPQEKLLDVVCFGNFEVFADGKPINFGRSISKELMACLIDRRGARMTVPELHSLACESRQNLSRQSVYQALYSLKMALNAVGAEKVLIAGPGSYAIDISRVRCDYFRLLEGDENAARSFMGEYMKQYPWAEATCGWLVMNFEGKQDKY
jgi:two-component SAPR family response regulator